MHKRRLCALQSTIPPPSGSSTSSSTQRLFTDDSPSAMYIDMDMLRATLRGLREANFPANTLHTFAIKANPLAGVLAVLKDEGFGAEAASFGELSVAHSVGFRPDYLVFDSPAKTVAELKASIQAGIRVNVDNFTELERVKQIVGRVKKMSSIIGMRINPQVGAGAIQMLSVAGKSSKFGVPLSEHRSEIIEAFVDNRSWLRGLHLHVGSQGCPLELIVSGVAAVWELLIDIRQAGGVVDVLDIGGGCPVDYSADDVDGAAAFHRLAALLKERVPQLWDGNVQLVTENGRSLLAKNGWTASRVEYTKESGGQRYAVIHVGADLFVRTCYLPQQWPVRLFVCDPQGRPKEETEEASSWREVNVVGPCCFSGDVLAAGRKLPPVDANDLIIIADTGAYTLSMYSRYNSRCVPPVFGYSIGEDGKVDVQVLKSAESVQDIVQFWSRP